MTISVFPSLPGLSWDVVRTEIWNTTTIESASGRRYAQGNWTYPKRRFSLTFAFLRARLGEYSTLVGFFNARKGGLEPFFWLDPLDFQAINQFIANGDGTTTQFQLCRTFGGSIEPVFGKKLISSIKVNNVEISDYVVSETGLLTFNSAPSANSIITWSGEFYQYVHFEDELETTEFCERLLSSGSVVFESVKL